MSELTKLTITQAREKLQAGDITSVELTRAFVDEIDQADALNAFITKTPEKALEMAALSDQRRAKGEAAGNLEGIPVGIKDLFCTKGTLTTAGSHILDGFVPDYDSTVTTNMWRDGAVMLGKLNLDEFAMGSSNETSYYGPVVNPWQRKGSNVKLVPGGSSGGSATEFCAHLDRATTTTDTGG